MERLSVAVVHAVEWREFNFHMVPPSLNKYFKCQPRNCGFTPAHMQGSQLELSPLAKACCEKQEQLVGRLEPANALHERNHVAACAFSAQKVGPYCAGG